MNTRRSSVFPLVPLLLAASLSACAPAQMTGPATRPTVISGAAYDAAQKVQVAEISDQTPGSSYTDSG